MPGTAHPSFEESAPPSFERIDLLLPLDFFHIILPPLFSSVTYKSVPVYRSMVQEYLHSLYSALNLLPPRGRWDWVGLECQTLWCQTLEMWRLDKVVPTQVPPRVVRMGSEFLSLQS